MLLGFGISIGILIAGVLLLVYQIKHKATDLQKAVQEHKRKEERITHLNLVLQAIRNVNQLIVREKDRVKLIQQACKSLEETRGYFNVWIALFDENTALLESAEAGLGKDFIPLVNQFKAGRITACGQRALHQPGVVVTKDPASTCHDCPLSASYVGRAGLTLRLEHNGKVYGLISASTDSALCGDENEIRLFQELARDIAFALFSIELEQARTQAEISLRENERFLSSVLDSIQDGISVLDPDLTIVYVNKTIRQWHSDKLPVEGKKCYESYQNRDSPCEPCPSLRAIKTGNMEKDIVQVRGSPAEWIELFSYPIKDPESGNVTSVVEFVRDITEKISAEDQLRQSQERFRKLSSLTFEGILIHNDGVVIDVNESLTKIVGYPRDELIGQNIVNLCVLPQYHSTIAQNILKDFAEPYQVMGIRKDGTLFPVELEARSVKSKEEKYRVVAIRDVTERVKEEKKKEALEAQLRQSQKLESIGTLASGMAHEINNPLTGIINYADLIGSRTDSSQLKEFANAIIKEGNRVTEIVKGLLSFARQDKQGHSRARMQDIISAVLAISGATLRKDQIEIQQKIAPSLPWVNCRSQQIEQVILNLLTNARDALNQRDTSNHEAKVIKISIYRFENDGIRWVRTTIEDNGIGISKDIIDRVFDPFFTTKPREKGTGLGLSVSYGIVREHKGRLMVESKPNQYTRFHLDLRANDDRKLKQCEEGISTERL